MHCVAELASVSRMLDLGITTMKDACLEHKSFYLFMGTYFILVFRSVSWYQMRLRMSWTVLR